MRISDWSSDVCSSDLSVIKTGKLAVNLDTKTVEVDGVRVHLTGKEYQMLELLSLRKGTTLTKEMFLNHLYGGMDEPELKRSEEHTSELQSLMRISYAVFCLKQKTQIIQRSLDKSNKRIRPIKTK